ncbi:Zinc finger, LIM-type [Penicillium camemberti]|uniref:Zinc finger, LIM-type n=1 Tax=Penicillium camemberti (strain FM 013) TaxID=1429867 RepID=A0A0G4PB89_PENC3|nr:Zinc finger, LIM-type [Penicillium camemberti]
MMHKHTTGQRKVSPPGPSFMSNDQVSTYLKDLRANRPARPTGSRPYPGRAAASTSDLPDSLPPRASSAFSMHAPVEDEIKDDRRSGSAMSHRRTNSHVPGAGAMGRPLAQEPRTHSIRKNVFPAQIHARTIPIPASPALSYRENGQRRHEKEEARSLRDALQKMDVQDDVGLHQAAQDEATELVWMHQNPGQAFKNPYAPYQNPDANRGNQSPVRNDSRGSNPSTNRFSQSTGSSVSSDGNSSPESIRKRSSLAGPSKKNLKVNFKLPDEEPEQPVAPKPRTVSSDSSKGIFRNPNDQIYEEPIDPKKEHEAKPDFSKSDSSALKNKPRNALGRVPRPLPWLQNRAHSSPVMDKISKFEIHKNPPTQSRDAGYTRNESATPPPTQSNNAGYTRNERATPTPPPEQKDESVPTQDLRERRSDDIRAATSKRRGDRSEKLPMPSAVSDRVGRPIVSFDQTWKPADQPKPDRPTLPVIEVAAPTIEVSAPTIEVSEPPPIPVINVPDIKVPTISEIEAPSKQPTRPMPQPTRNSPTKQAFPKQQGSDSQSRWYSPYTRSGVPTASCELCTLSISGKIVTAGGCRFHPECFTCFHCHTALECVAFYQEPESSRDERLATTDAHDQEARVPRFYCHLDFHEMFSPRCKSCKTPIEGEVVVACGAEWHVGHFFCAECGDPFDSQTPFVEKDGFAWCLHCHSRRTAPRCLGCKQHVMDEVVISAIGGQWHERCFNCHECGDGFGPEGRFFVREGEPKRTAKGRIIGGPVQLAICERCEGIRLKAPGMC